jgi:hypothetical protein
MRRPWVLALLLLGGGSIGLYFLLRGGSGPAGPGGGFALPGLGSVLPLAHVNEETFDKLRTGMTEDEVVAVIGPPTVRKVGPDDPNKAPVIAGSNITVTDLVHIVWQSGQNKIEVGFDVKGKAFLGRAWFDDGQGGLFELLGNKFDQLSQSGDQTV